MILLFLLIIALLVVLTAAVFVLGFRLGTERPRSELARVKLEALQAERRLHDLTREGFEAVIEAAKRRQRFPWEE